MVTARQVASYFIQKASTLGDGNNELSGNNDLTNLKLQKMLYFAQVEYLKEYGKPLFSENIQAWRYGPVVKEVYDWIISAGCGPYVITNFDVVLEDLSNIPDHICTFLDKIWEKYQEYSAWKLVKKTHENGSVWNKVYANGDGDRQIISIDLLRQAAIL